MDYSGLEDGSLLNHGGSLVGAWVPSVTTVLQVSALWLASGRAYKPSGLSGGGFGSEAGGVPLQSHL